MSKPWFIDLLTYAVVGLWFLLTYATMRQHGPNPSLLLSSVVMLVTGLLMIYGQRLTHLEIGERIVLDLRSPEQNPGRKESQEQEQE